jgi:hypothetical protein
MAQSPAAQAIEEAMDRFLDFSRERDLTIKLIPRHGAFPEPPQVLMEIKAADDTDQIGAEGVVRTRDEITVPIGDGTMLPCYIRSVDGLGSSHITFDLEPSGAAFPA